MLRPSRPIRSTGSGAAGVRTAFNKEILRTVARSIGRFGAIFAIVALGAGFYAGLRMTAPDMRLSADRYLDSTRFMDVRVLSTLGFSSADATAVAEIPGVQTVMPSHSADVMADIGDKSSTARVHSLSRDGLNRPTLVEGRWPTASGECVIDSRALDSTTSPIGKKIVFTSGVRPLDETFVRSDFTVVGVVESSYYVSFQRGTTTLGSGEIGRFLYIPATDFADPGTYTDLFVSVEGARDVSSFGSEYGELVAPVVSAIEEKLPSLEASRTAQVKASAQKELDAKRAEYDAARAEADTKLAEGQAQLDAAAEKIAASEAQLASSRKRYDTGVAELAAQRKAFERQTAEAQVQIDVGRAQIAEQSGQLGALAAALPALREQVASLESQVGLLQSAYDAAVSAEASGTVVSPSAAELAASLSQAQAGLAQARQAYAAQSATYEAGTAQLTAATRNLDSKQADLAAAKREAPAKFSAAQAQLDSARRQIASGTTALADARASLESARAAYAAEKAEAETALAENAEKLADAQAQIDAIDSAQFYVVDRDTNEGFASLKGDAKRIEAISFVFPVIFFLVAALVALTTMTRMVEEERTLIGTYKALGYSRTRIASKYVLYAGLASVLGSVTGIFLGSRLIPTTIWNAYQTIYTTPAFYTPIDPASALIAGGAAAGITLFATIAAVASTLREGPATLMLPRAPKPGKRILLERIKPVWSRFSFLHKVTARNLFRYKKRLLMTVVGIAGCATLLLTGFALRDSVNDVLKKQYGEIYSYNIAVGVDGNAFAAENPSDGRALALALDSSGRISDALGVRTQSIRMSGANADEDQSAEGFLRVPSDPARFTDFVTLRTRTTGEALALGDSGIVITEKAANTLGVEVGDEVRIEPIDAAGGSTGAAAGELTVIGIAEQYVGNFIYISPTLYETTFGEAPEYNDVLGRTSVEPGPEQEALTQQLLAQEGVESLRFTSDITESYGKMLQSLNFVVLVLIISAGALAFIVLYNLTNLNITERRRELATIKVLGFYDSEVNAYIYRETALLTIIGCAIGLVLGVVLEAVVIRTVEVDLVMFGRDVYPTSFIFAAGLTFVFWMIVNLAMRPRLRKIDMVESLKSVE